MRHALAAGWIAFVAVLLGTSPVHWWLDAGEIAAATAEMGVLHPPGAPGLTHLSRLLAVVPLGPLGFRVAASGAVFVGATVFFLWLIAARHRVHPFAGWVMTFVVLSSLTYVRNARVAEIYAFGTFLAVVTIWAFDPRIPRNRRDRMRLIGVFAASVAALGFGNLRVSLGLWLAAAFVQGMRRRRTWTRYAPLVCALGLAVVLCLPASSARDPVTDWGNPETLASLWDHLQATSIRASFAEEILPPSLPLWIEHLKGALRRLVEDLGAVTAVAVGAAVVWLAWSGGRPRRRRLTLVLLFLAAVELVYAVGINPMGGPDRQTAVLLTPICALALALALHGATTRLGRLRWALLPVCVVAFSGSAVAERGFDGVNTGSAGPQAYVGGALSQLAPGALLLSQSDDLAAGLLYAQVVEGARPDVTAVAAQHLYKEAPADGGRGQGLARVHAGAAGAADDEARIHGALAAWSGPVALEHAGAGLFASVAFWSPRGRPPLSVAGPGSHAQPIVGPEDAMAYWEARLPGPLDRRRLSIILGNRARALVRQAPMDPGVIAQALQWLGLALGRVDPHHPSNLVAAGVLFARLGDQERAVALTRLALEVEPTREAALLNLAGYLAARPGGLAEAQELIERARALRPWRGPPSRAYEASGEPAP